MLFDTDVLIWVQRRNIKAIEMIEKTPKPYISVQTYLELMQYAKNKNQLRYTKSFLHEVGFEILPLTPETGTRAIVYIEEFGLTHSLSSGYALIAATATEYDIPLLTGNHKHFAPIKDLDLRIFRA